MKHEDFCYMRRGKHLAELTIEELTLLAPVNQRDTGKYRALLVLHGFSSSPAVYRYMIPELTNYNAIVCPSLPGHGDSLEAFSRSKASEWVNKAAQTCEQLMNEYEKVDVLGLSLGGLIACELSKSFPLNHLFLLAPALKLNIRINAMLTLARVLQYVGFRFIRNAAGNLKTNQHAEIGYKKLPLSSIMEILTLARNYQWKAPACPIDLFLGTYDEVVVSKKVEQLFANLPNATIHWLENSAHVLPLDNDFRDIISCINKTK